MTRLRGRCWNAISTSFASNTQALCDFCVSSRNTFIVWGLGSVPFCHVHTDLLPAALSNAVLMDSRWLLDGVNKEVGGSHLWTRVMRVTPSKQLLFLRRVLFLHGLAHRRAGKASPVKLSASEWGKECNRMALLGHVLEEMHSAMNASGAPLFAEDLLTKLLQQCIEGPLSTHWFLSIFSCSMLNTSIFSVNCFCHLVQHCSQGSDF